MDSKNHWETQPRESNGQFGERPVSTPSRLHLWEKILKNVTKTLSERVNQNAKGGSYGELRKETAGNKSVEIHHMPADSASPLSRWKGPCITLEKEEHQKTVAGRDGRVDSSVAVLTLGHLFHRFPKRDSGDRGILGG